MKFWSREVHQRMSKWLLRCQWHDMKNHCTIEWKKQWSTIGRCNQSKKHKYIKKKPENQWNHESLNQGINESMEQRFANSMSQTIIHDLVFQSTGASMNQRIIGSMNQWIWFSSLIMKRLWIYGWFTCACITWHPRFHEMLRSRFEVNAKHATVSLLISMAVDTLKSIHRVSTASLLT